MWRFENIPEAIRPDVKTAFRNDNYKFLKRVIKKYDVAPPAECGNCNQNDVIKEWFTYAIHYGLL